MNSRHFRAPLRFHRSMDAAFNTPRYGAAIEKPYPSFWRRLFNAFKEGFCG